MQNSTFYIERLSSCLPAHCYSAI